jgi:glycosyltransferase involved in cell wall biosynthesis
MNATPKISVIMSVYNGEDYLAETLDSICSQTFKDWELIAINDCSTDTTLSILEKYASSDERIKIYTNEVNLRLPKSLNKGLSLAQGKYIARMDADDICLENRFEMQYKFMEEHPDVALSSCRFMTLKNGVLSSGGGGERYDSEFLKARLLLTNPILHPGVIAKADVMKELKYNTDVTCTEDLELWTRFMKAGYKIQIQTEYLMIYRLHDKQITKTSMERQHKEVAEILKDYYSALLEPLNEQQIDFCIHGLYFRENINVDKFCEFYKWVKTKNKKKKNFESHALDYALFEILAEYKRCGITKVELMKAMANFNLYFLLKEIPKRKKRTAEDGLKCIAAAERIGYKHTSGSIEFPSFS